jgi:uncharacterized RDD family membrane protein YckC
MFRPRYGRSVAARSRRYSDGVAVATYPGQELGLPEAGRGAVASMGRRLGAIFIDWLLCTFIVLALIRPRTQADVEGLTLAVFAVQDMVLTALIGMTVGKRLFGIRVARLDGKIIGAWAVLRTLLLLTVVAPLLTDRDLRGLHDRAANTVVVRM